MSGISDVVNHLDTQGVRFKAEIVYYHKELCSAALGAGICLLVGTYRSAAPLPLSVQEAVTCLRMLCQCPWGTKGFSKLHLSSEEKLFSYNTSHVLPL